MRSAALLSQTFNRPWLVRTPAMTSNALDGRSAVPAASLSARRKRGSKRLEQVTVGQR
ncbi:MAG TPA: hypothetical protein VGH84_10485 [Steroidobacteraceae bacterium]|jgi:hypothetical protein